MLLRPGSSRCSCRSPAPVAPSSFNRTSRLGIFVGCDSHSCCACLRPTPCPALKCGISLIQHSSVSGQLSDDKSEKCLGPLGSASPSCFAGSVDCASFRRQTGDEVMLPPGPMETFSGVSLMPGRRTLRRRWHQRDPMVQRRLKRRRTAQGLCRKVEFSMIWHGNTSN